MGESDHPDEERMHHLFKEEVQKCADEVVEALEIFAQDDPQSEGARDGKRDDFSKTASDIMGKCGAIIGGLQWGEEEGAVGEEAIGRTKKCLEEIQRLLEDFCRLASEEYGNRGKEVSAVVHEIIKKIGENLSRAKKNKRLRCCGRTGDG
ncbi:hypothetical protein, unlikely [Trypanosoma congolense IL3000]|uniref:Uncharacterized protein n=1 Tax=Trypanosoma congolense (strain IL3000) TaxID=1068625 RepID=F9WEZ7_TRYCI|nr:hypothetical protein, unlikely [Trypanosoma congolense IL3000]CCD15195.1 hypothetical protein, unlikely [Trypanosoma congolense IL3000]CCD15863.1 hypothetical protein, unlikely [Trypanosoma congolense IL3000]